MTSEFGRQGIDIRQNLATQKTGTFIRYIRNPFVVLKMAFHLTDPHHPWRREIWKGALTLNARLLATGAIVVLFSLQPMKIIKTIDSDELVDKFEQMTSLRRAVMAECVGDRESDEPEIRVRPAEYRSQISIFGLWQSVAKQAVANPETNHSNTHIIIIYH